MSTYAATFREIVIPDLRRMCAARGLFVALDLEGFDEACGIVLDEARRRGARHLPDDTHRDLEDWICTTVLQSVDAAMPTVQGAEAATDKRLWAVIMERPWPTSR